MTLKKRSLLLTMRRRRPSALAKLIKSTTRRGSQRNREREKVFNSKSTHLSSAARVVYIQRSRSLNQQSVKKRRLALAFAIFICWERSRNWCSLRQLLIVIAKVLECELELLDAARAADENASRSVVKSRIIIAGCWSVCYRELAKIYADFTEEICTWQL
jgi:hypothetical protein